MLNADGKIVRVRIVHRDFICKGAEHHKFRAAVKVGVVDDGTEVERSAEFLVIRNSAAPFQANTAWIGLPVCLECGAIAEEASTYNPDTAQVPESERTVAFLSADGTQIAIPGKRDAPMAERYAVAGYRRIEAHSMRDIDRMQAIRERQTGNTVDNEMNYEPESRKWHDEAPYDSEDMSNRI